MTTQRTPCGEPRSADAGRDMTVFGWVDRRRDLGGLTFIDVRDRSGIVQVVLNPETSPAAHDAAKSVRNEWVVRVRGSLRARAAENVNPRIATGEVELVAADLEVLSEARTPPFPVNEETDVEERLRLRHRYLDLRRPTLQRNLRARATFIAALRAAMDSLGFTEIETPMLVRATPEGARDYLVPSRVFPGRFYALPQSPQLYKQICMVAGLDRYYQIARCMRDEDLRADRQPEFTQLDVEMSFVDEEDVFAVLEHAISAGWAAAGFAGEIATPFPRLTWAEAMSRYGSDKPDVRFGLELQDLTDAVRTTQFQVFARTLAAGGVVRGLRVPGGADMTRGDIEGELTDVARAHRARGLAYVWRREEGFDGLVARHLGPGELAEIERATGAVPGDLVLMVADRPQVAAAALGALRLHLGRRRGLVDEGRLAMLWVTEFPMFELDEETGRPTPLHHPFTMVVPEDVPLLDSADAAELLRIRSRAYDIVLNGREIGSGSIRIHRADVQRKVFSAIGLSDDDARRKFGFLLEAFEHGVPPHGGFAAGIDRLVMEGLREENIRDVIAFPKTQQAQELMTDAPATVEPQQLTDLGIALRPAPPAPQRPDVAGR